MIVDQPSKRVLAVVGEDLVLQLKVKGEQPFRCSIIMYLCVVCVLHVRMYVCMHVHNDVVYINQ